MPADLELRRDGTAAMAVGEGKPAWHGLASVHDVLTVEEAYTEVPELVAEIRQEPIYARMGNGQPDVLPDVVANIRQATPVSDEKYVGTVGARGYTLVQPREAFSIAEAILDVSDAEVASAGTIRDGRQAFLMLRLPDDYFIPGDEAERRERYLGVVNSYDGSLALTVCRTSIRWVCSNTVQAGLSVGQRHAIRHTISAQDRVRQARAAVGLAELHAARQARLAEWLADTRVTDADVQHLLDGTFPVRPDSERSAAIQGNRRQAVQDLYVGSPAVGDKHGTAWGYLQAVTEWTSHHQTRRDTAVASADENRFNALVLGTDWVAAHALNAILGLPQVSPEARELVAAR